MLTHTHSSLSCPRKLLVFHAVNESAFVSIYTWRDPSIIALHFFFVLFPFNCFCAMLTYLIWVLCSEPWSNCGMVYDIPCSIFGFDREHLPASTGKDHDVKWQEKSLPLLWGGRSDPVSGTTLPFPPSFFFLYLWMRDSQKATLSVGSHLPPCLWQCLLFSCWVWQSRVAGPQTSGDSHAHLAVGVAETRDKWNYFWLSVGSVDLDSSYQSYLHSKMFYPLSICTYCFD